MRVAFGLTLLMLVTVLNCMQDPASPTGSTESALAVCGDNSCAPGVEDCGTCPGDCPCPGGFFCSSRQCVPICGDGVCQPNVEGCSTCPVDCPCPDGLACSSAGQCVDPDPCHGDPCCGDPCCRRPQSCCQVQDSDGQMRLIECPLQQPDRA